MHLAVSFGYRRIVELLLEAGADLDIENDKRETALHSAVSGWNPETNGSLVVGRGYCQYSKVSGKNSAG